MHLWPVFLISTALCTRYATSHKQSSNSTAFITQSLLRSARAPGGAGKSALVNYRFTKPPQGKRLDPRELRLILGSDFDPRFVSMDKPLNTEDFSVGRKDLRRLSEVLDQLQASNLSQELPQLVDFPLQPEHFELVEKWMVEKASCPVRYTWEDLGDMFWPRYVLRGDCSTGAKSCSWPSGMQCVPTGTRTLSILRWQCRIPRGKNRRRHLHRDYRGMDGPQSFKCHWVRVPYPTTDECTCSC